MALTQFLVLENFLFKEYNGSSNDLEIAKEDKLMNEDIQMRAESSFFGTAIEWESDLFSVLELFPIPTEVFSADGISLFVNTAFKDFFISIRIKSLESLIY